MKKMIFLFIGLFLCVTLFSAPEERGKSAGKVRTVSPALLRLAPDGAVLGKIPEGTVLELLAVKNSKWAKVLLPENFVLWTLVSEIRKDSLLAPGAPLRTGPGAFYPSPGKARGGEKIVKLEKSPGGSWQKIRLKKNFFLVCYCQRSDLAELPFAETVPVPEEKREKIFFQEHSSAEGTLILLPEKERKKGVEYALAVHVGNTTSIRTYLQGAKEDLARWKGRRVRISGKKIWKENFSRPLLLSEKIEPAWDH